MSDPIAVADKLTADLIEALTADRKRWRIRAIEAEKAIAAAPTRNPMPTNHEVVTTARELIRAFNSNDEPATVILAFVKLENALSRLT